MKEALVDFDKRKEGQIWTDEETSKRSCMACEIGEMEARIEALIPAIEQEVKDMMTDETMEAGNCVPASCGSVPKTLKFVVCQKMVNTKNDRACPF